MSVRGIMAARTAPLRGSAAATRDLIRQAMQAHPPGHLGRQGARRGWSVKSWKSRLANCRKNPYHRTGSKKSRDWPDRQHDRPPGPPIIRIASEKEVRQAQKLLAKPHAA